MDDSLVVFVACLVLLTGCNALSPGSNAADRGITDTVTPVPVPESGSPTPASEQSYPPGLSADGRVDADRLQAAHNASVGGESYTWTYTRSRGERPNATRQFARRVAVEGEVILVRDTNANFLPNRTLYLAGGDGHLRRGSDNVSRVAPPGAGDHHEYAPAGRLIGAFLPDRDATVTVVERDGQQFYRLYVPPGGPPPGLRSDAGAGWSVLNYTVTLSVAPSGFVRSVAVGYDRKLASGESHRVSIRFDYAAVSETTVTRPGWVPETGGTTTASAAPGTR